MLVDMKKAEIVRLADIHIGTDEQFFLDKLDYIAQTQNAYCILNGDLLNNAITSSVSDSYSELLTPTEAMTRSVALLTQSRIKLSA